MPARPSPFRRHVVEQLEDRSLPGVLSVTATAAPDFYGKVELEVLADDLGNTGSDGAKSGSGTITLSVTPLADAPSVSGVTTDEDVPATVVVARNAADGDEVTHFKVTGIAGGTLFRADGTRISDGDFVTVAEGLAGLTFRPGADLNGETTAFFGFGVQASTSGTDAGLGGGVAAATVAVNPVNDAPAFDLSAAGEIVVDASGAFSWAGFAGNFRPGPPAAVDEAGQTPTYTLTNTNNALFSVQPAVDASGRLTFTVPPGTYGTAIVTVTVSDGGGTANGGADSSQWQFTLSVTPLADAPSVSGVTTDEDVPATVVVARNAADGDEVTHFKVTGIAGGTLFRADGTRISDGDFVTVAEGLAGLTFRPGADLNGETTAFFGFGVQASTSGTDAGLGGGVAAATVAVNPVNDAPAFDLSAGRVTVRENSGAFGRAGFAGNFRPGPPAAVDEAGQTPTYTLTNTNNALFSVQPAVDASGRLTFTLAPGTYGTATVTVVVRDGGGTANGGADSSQRRFTITTPLVLPLVADLGGRGLWHFTAAGAWVRLSRANVEGAAVSAHGETVAADFGARGLRLWTQAGGWTLLSKANAQRVTVSADGGAVVADFGAKGLHRWTPGGGWVRLARANVQGAVVSADGNTVVADFGVRGLMRWTPGGGWVNLLAVDPERFSVSDDGGTIVADFGAKGLRHWNASAGTWVRLERANVEGVVVSADGNTVVADFGAGGLRRWTAAGGWSVVTTANVERFSVSDDGGTVVTDRGPRGLRRWSGGDWVRLSRANAQNLGISEDGERVAADFGAKGLRYYNHGVWVSLSPRDPDQIWVG